MPNVKINNKIIKLAAYNYHYNQDPDFWGFNHNLPRAPLNVIMHDVLLLQAAGATISDSDIFCWQRRLDAGDPDNNNCYAGVLIALNELHATPALSTVDLLKLSTPVDFEKIQNKKLIEKIENGGQENSPDTITAYKCGRGYLIVAAVAENTEVFFTTDEEKTKSKSLIDWAIYDSVEPIQLQVTRCCYGVDTVADYSVAENFDGEVIICQEESLPGYSPITILTKNDVEPCRNKNDSYYRSDDYMVFKSVPEAQDWIQDSRGYTIWAAV